MSRIGNMPVLILQGVTVEKTGKKLVVKGPKGSLSLTMPSEINAEIEGDQIIVKRQDDSKKSKSLHGLTRSLLSNMVTGVNSGWSKTIELVGVGFRAQGSSDKITLSIGFSHPVEFEAPEGVEFAVRDNVKIDITGIDKYLVGQVASKIRAIKPPDVYKGKGIRYSGEYVRRKPGKAGKAGAGGAK